MSSRRKKAFTIAHQRGLERLPSRGGSTPDNIKQEKQDDAISLNVRRSARKPKPKKNDDFYEDDIDLAEPTTITMEAEGGEDSSMANDSGLSGTPELAERVGSRRETRKTFQSYLEQLGYNTDFSKIASDGSDYVMPMKSESGQKSNAEETSAVRRKFGERSTKMKVDETSAKMKVDEKSAKMKIDERSAKMKVDERPAKIKVDEQSTKRKGDEKAVTKIKVHDATCSTKLKVAESGSKSKNTIGDVKTTASKSPSAEKSAASAKVRVSSRTPKPKRTFSLLEDELQIPSKAKCDNVASYDAVVSAKQEFFEDTEKVELSKTPKTKRKSSNKFEKVTPIKHSVSIPQQQQQQQQTVSMTTPLSRQDVPELSGSEDSSQTRTSKRARIPKRKFSLIEEEAPPEETKKQRVLSPEQEKDIQISKIKDEPVDGDVEEKVQTKLVIKRSSARKRSSSRLENQMGVEIKHEEDSAQKRKDNRSEKAYVEPEKKIISKGEKRKLNEPKDNKQEAFASNKNKKGIEDVVQSIKARKMFKRKKSDTKSGTKGESKKSDKEHIVLKLTIPHEASVKSEEKVHEKHHHKHHKHKKDRKERESDENKKKTKFAETEESFAEVSSKDDEKLAIADVKVKKKKKKKPTKLNENSESLTSSDASSVPHVKLVIKKSPVKGVKLMPDVELKPSASDENIAIVKTEPAENAEQDSCKAEAPAAKKPSTKESPTKKSSTKKKPPPKVKQLKKKQKQKKDGKVRMVTAYYLFTQSRRKGLQEMEPGLDFSNTSRRLAEMWKEQTDDDKEFWRTKARLINNKNKKGKKGGDKGKPGSLVSRDSDTIQFISTEPIDMAAYLKLLGESLCSIGVCLKRQDQMEVHGSLSVLLDTALCSIVPLFCLTSQIPEMSGCSAPLQAKILDNLAYIIPGL